MLILPLVLAGLAAGQDVRSCRATFDGSELIIANRRMERRWRVGGRDLHATSFRDLRAGVEWLRPGKPPAGKTEAAFSAKTGVFGPVEPESLVAELAIAGRTYRFQVFPNASGVRMGWSEERVQGDPRGPGGPPHLSLENFELAPPHLKLTQVTLLDQTDVHNELVFENEWLLQGNEKKLQLQGNLFVLEDPHTGAGLIFLKEAPLPHARPEKTEADFVSDPRASRVALLGGGYRWVTLAYTGGRAGRTEALHGYQRQLRVYDAKRDGMFLSNTWGDRSRDARINDAFLRREVDAGARLGVDVVQIDDGWQQGRTANSATAGGVWNGFWAADPNFWNVNRARFPDGLEPVIKLAAGKGMGFGLWFAPDSSHDFANWEKDAAKILELHRGLGVRYFKIDGVKAISRRSEENLGRLFDRVLREARGAVTFDLDVTAEIRPGYFGSMNTGPLFVENRYTDSHRYWPHQTLRNLWKLAQYVDPLRLRMEFLNNSRNEKLYEGDPLAPARYQPGCLFATIMMANPLGWFEVSGLPPAYFEQVAPLVKTWKAERARMAAGRTLPIGAAPDGVAWTGFASVAEDRRGGYVLAFRELNGSAEWREEAPWLEAGRYRVKVLGGKGSVSVEGGRLTVSVPERLGFVWARVDHD